jgi:hypothetical protein
MFAYLTHHFIILFLRIVKEGVAEEEIGVSVGAGGGVGNGENPVLEY